MFVAPCQEIKGAYRSLSKQYHPDKTGHLSISIYLSLSLSLYIYI